MIGLDGTSWLTYLGYQHNDRLPFAQIGADPVQGNFDAYFPVAQEYLLPGSAGAAVYGRDPLQRRSTIPSIQ
jgi:hypothetical protein